MNIKSKKGHALAMAIIFVIILIISSIGLYTGVEYLAKEVRVQEIGRIRGYYAALAGLRYATILLRAPGSIAYEIDGITVDNSAYSNFFTDIGVDSADLTITITEITDPDDPNYGKYTVSASYQY